jgi:hypothetical protein
MDDLIKVQDTLNSALSELTNTGMDPVDLGPLMSSLQQFDSALDDIISMSHWMAETLGTTWQKIQQNEQDNTDLASGLTVQPEPPEFLPEAQGSAGDTTLAPGQTIGLCVALEGLPAT